MKNIVTNIVGILIIGLSIYGLLYLELEVFKFGVLSLMGGVFIYFKNYTIKKYLKKSLDKILK